MSRDSATVSNNMRKIHSKDTSIDSYSEKLYGTKVIAIAKIIKLSLVLLTLFLPNIKLLFFAIVNFFTERIGKFSSFVLKRVRIQTFGSKKLSEIVIVIMKMIKSFYS